MEMQINIDLIKAHRKQRAWSQTHLADVSGLSLRTIQRIEKSGTASLESVKSIASVLEVEVSALQKSPESLMANARAKIAALVGFFSIALSSVFVLTATAKPVMVDLQLKADGEVLADVQLLNKENSASEMQLTEQVKVLLTSSIEKEGRVKISTEIYDLSSGKAVLIASPAIVTKHQKQAEIHFGHFELSLTPNL